MEPLLLDYHNGYIYCCVQVGEAILAATGETAALRMELSAREARTLGNWLLETANELETQKARRARKDVR